MKLAQGNRLVWSDVQLNSGARMPGTSAAPDEALFSSLIVLGSCSKGLFALTTPLSVYDYLSSAQGPCLNYVRPAYG
jgi:hypothetical protein